MLRFGSAAPSKKAGLSGRERLRLWMLVIALGVVVASMRQLRQPETVENLDRLFIGQAQPPFEKAVEEADDRVLLESTGPRTSESPANANSLERSDSASFSESREFPSDESSSDLSGVRDNTYFRPEERNAWFDLFARLQAMDPSQLAGATVGEVTYAQLLQQPDVYRGQVVTLRGMVLREEVQQPAENTLGIARYHRLWLRPQGGGQWPFVVYCLKLPADFPRGDQLRADVTVTGFFFKNWSYSYDEGLGLAPVVLASGVDWQPPVAPAPRQTLTPQNLVWAATGAALFALATVWWAVRRTVRRPRRVGRLPDTFLLSVAMAWIVSGCFVSGCVPVAIAAEQADDSFQDVLALAGLGREVLATLTSDADYGKDDWQVLAQLVYRLRQFPPAQLQRWASAAPAAPWNVKADEHLGQIHAITATVESVEPVNISGNGPPEKMAAETVLPKLYRCRFRLADGTAGGVVLVPRVPNHWQRGEISEEPVRFLGVGLGSTADNKDRVRLLLTNHLAWYPRKGVSSGRLLLARQGMDIALLDEVKQRQPFVKPEVSREGEAFYQCLAALAAVDRQELEMLTEQTVAATALQWLAKKPIAQQRQAELRHELAATNDSTEREALEQDLETARRDLALATAVEKQADRKLSSVAPLFLQPDGHVGELVRIEGVARRAVRIAIPGGAASQASTSGKLSFDAYYEMEVFTADSQNLPVVCCVSRLPAEFPVGDKIREPVRVDGVFFKSWRYRTRKNLVGPGETGRQQQMVTPVVVGGVPTWLPTATSGQNRWGLWGGMAFLAALVVFWFVMFRLAERDRRRRAAMQPARLDDLPGKH
ncbi:MAG: hypothetical protein IH898_01635 [Planctomycetes bacterium]|nr:hypothetical protein [Planctomycetota bacterium]